MKQARIIFISLIAALSSFYGYVLFVSEMPQVSSVYRAYYFERKLRVWNRGIGPIYELGQIMDFSDECPWLSRKGWGGREQHGAWSNGASAEIFLSIGAKAQASELTVSGYPFTAPQAGIHSQSVRIYINDIYVDSHVFSEEEEVTSKLPVQFREHEPPGGFIRIRFEFPDRARPKDLHISSDSRELGLFVHKMILK